jgi:phi13 family phage major tail protein
VAEVFEFRGVDNLVYAEVIRDDNDTDGGYITGIVKPLSPVATISKEVETSSETHYYDNLPMIVINAEGADTISLTVAPLSLETLCDITGKSYYPEYGMMIDGEATPKYFAIGYRTKGTDGKYRHVWRFKGQFAMPSEEVNTENDSIETTNTELTFTGISTVHKFSKNGKPAKGIVVDERLRTEDLTAFFDTVTTPDTIEAAVDRVILADADGNILQDADGNTLTE